MNQLFVPLLTDSDIQLIMLGGFVILTGLLAYPLSENNPRWPHVKSLSVAAIFSAMMMVIAYLLVFSGAINGTV